MDSRLPPEHIEKWAEVLGVERKKFARHLFKDYDPTMYRLVFDKSA